MQTIKILVIFLAFFTSYAQAQNKVNSTNQSRTIEINNANGELTISFENNIITEFIVNNNPIAKERYSEYQDIIDDFSQDVIQISNLSVPIPSFNNQSQSEKLNKIIVEYLMDNGIINSFKKYNIQLKRNFLKVNGQKASQEIHHACLDFFDKIYGHKLNVKSEVIFKKSGTNSKSSVKIIDLD